MRFVVQFFTVVSGMVAGLLSGLTLAPLSFCCFSPFGGVFFGGLGTAVDKAADGWRGDVKSVGAKYGGMFGFGVLLGLLAALVVRFVTGEFQATYREMFKILWGSEPSDDGLLFPFIVSFFVTSTIGFMSAALSAALGSLGGKVSASMMRKE